MSIATEQAATTLKERGAGSTRRFYEALGLGVVAAKNLPYLTIALTEAATEEIAHNAVLRERIASLYRELLPPTKKAPARTSGAARQESGRSTTGTRRGSSLAPGAAPDLYALAKHYTAAEWPTVLNKYTKESLKKAVALVQEQHPGTGPTSTSTKGPMVAYLLAYVPHVS